MKTKAVLRGVGWLPVGDWVALLMHTAPARGRGTQGSEQISR